MTTVSAIFYFLLIVFLARLFWRRETELKRFFWPAFTLKLLAGAGVGLLYRYYYTAGDTFAYFEDGSALAALARRDAGGWLALLFFGKMPEAIVLNFYQPRALFLTRITSVFNLITFDNYWVIGACFSAMCFAGAWYLVRTISRHLPDTTLPAVIAFLFLPSAVFWSSGLLKESLSMAALYFLAALFLKVWFNEKIRLSHACLAALGLCVLWYLKYYYVAVFLPVAGASLLYKFISPSVRGGAWRRSALWLTLFLLPLVAITCLHPNFYPERLLDVIIQNNAAYNALSAPDGVVHFHNLQPTASSLLANAPVALFSGLFRPLPWEASTLMPLLASAENALVLALFVTAVFSWRRYLRCPQRVLLVALGVYVAALCVFLTFSAPNFGTLSRYRVGYFPFFVFVLLYGSPLLACGQRSLRRLVSH